MKNKSERKTIFFTISTTLPVHQYQENEIEENSMQLSLLIALKTIYTNFMKIIKQIYDLPGISVLHHHQQHLW